MLNRFFTILFIFVLSISISGCLNSVIFDQNEAGSTDNANDFENQLQGFKRDFSMQNEKKEYETNRIFSNDFPVTYRAKEKKTF